MGEADRYIDFKDKGSYKKRNILNLGDSNNAVMAIIAINIIMFLFIAVTRVFYLFTHQGQGEAALHFDAIHWFAMPANLVSLSEKPWTVLTFMFAHGGLPPVALLFNMLSSMLWLWAFAYILQDLAGNKLIFPVYIYGSLLGAIFFIVAAYTFPGAKEYEPFLYLSGSIPGTTAIALAVTTVSPTYKMFRNIGSGIPVWVLTTIYILIAFLGAVYLSNANSFANLGAALAGFLFIYFLRKGKDTGAWMINLYNWIMNLFNPNKKNNPNSTKEKIFYNTGNRSPYEKKTNITQQRVDEILDKISQQGYHFLTDEEKEFLKRASEE